MGETKYFYGNYQGSQTSSWQKLLMYEHFQKQIYRGYILFKCENTLPGVKIMTSTLGQKSSSLMPYNFLMQKTTVEMNINI